MKKEIIDCAEPQYVCTCCNTICDSVTTLSKPTRSLDAESARFASDCCGAKVNVYN